MDITVVTEEMDVNENAELQLNSFLKMEVTHDLPAGTSTYTGMHPVSSSRIKQETTVVSLYLFKNRMGPIDGLGACMHVQGLYVSVHGHL